MALAASVSEDSSRASTAAIVGWLAGVVLGLVLAVAAVLKSLDPHGFAEAIAAQHAAFGLPPFAAALVALGIEAALGIALVLDLRRRSVMIAASVLVAFFLALTGNEAWRAAHGVVDSAGCGCFGNLVLRTPRQALFQDLGLLVPPLVLAWLGRPGARRALTLRWSLVAGFAIATVAFAAVAPRLPLDDVATRLRPGVAVADLCAGTGAARVCLPAAAPAVATGKHLVVIADAATPGFPELAARLNDYLEKGSGPGVVVLADVTPDEQQAMFWSIAPAFDLQPTPQALLRPLYRSLPRSFEVDAGRVVATWSGLPPQIPPAATKGAAHVSPEKP